MSIKNLSIVFASVSMLFFTTFSYAEEEMMIADDNGPSMEVIEDGPDYSYAEPTDDATYVSTRFDDEALDTPYSYVNAYASNDSYNKYYRERRHSSRSDRSGGSMPSRIKGHGERVIIVDPNIHAWGAYSEDGTLLRSGIATAGSRWCRDLHRPCKTRAGTFRIHSLGSSSCKSSKFPLGKGGAPMPYCMFFNGGQGLHGSYELAYANLSHGCVRISVDAAEWIRFNFARIGTKVIIRPY